MAQVKIIAPQTREAEHLRVAAYCRVSSDSKDQLHSYAAQIRNYTEEIAQHDGWELVDVYADEGLTGTRMDQRDDFNRMMRDCRKGKVDRILVKSVSRFARNTRDCLSALRELSAMGVSVRFEKENIDTKTLTTELMVSVSGSLAQQESISISANQKMSYQRRMERGEFITCTAPYGYRIVNKKDLEIVPEEAATVRWIFDAYLKGRSSGWIAEQLTAKGIPSQSGAECWRETGIRYLLTNEKYIGDALSQKSYSCGFPFVQKRNHGERLQYYTENSHPAIIDRDTFERVQVLLQKKAQKEKKRREKSPLALKIVCGNCGTVFQRRSSQNGYVTWVCRTHDRHAADCPVGRIPETEIHAAFLRMYHRLKSNADIILAPALRQLNTLDTILPYLHSFENLHLAIVAGNDEDYARHLRSECAELGLENVTVFDYVERMAALMAASDLVICKSGGLTVTECLCARVPMILLGKAYGQENINVRTLTANGAAMHATTARELLDTLRHVSRYPQSTDAMLINGSFLRRPDAARDIAHAAMRLAGKPPESDDPIRRKHFLHFYWGRKPAHIR